MLREIGEVIGTYDARHVLALCTDGGIMYYRRNEVDESAEFIEFSDLQRNADVDQIWSIKRIGSMGDVALLRATKSVDGVSTLVQVDLLSGEYLNTNKFVLMKVLKRFSSYLYEYAILHFRFTDIATEVKPTSFVSPQSENDWGYFFDGIVQTMLTSVDADTELQAPETNLAAKQGKAISHKIGSSKSKGIKA